VLLTYYRNFINYKSGLLSLNEDFINFSSLSRSCYEKISLIVLMMGRAKTVEFFVNYKFLLKIKKIELIQRDVSFAHHHHSRLSELREITRLLLIWSYSVLSMVNLIYDFLAD